MTQPEGYIRGTELYDPLTNGKTVGTIGGSGNVTWVPGQGIRMNDELAYVVYQLPQVFSSGEISVEVTGLNPGGPCCKPRIFSILDRQNAIASASKYSFNVQYRGAGGAPDNCITFKAVLGDNANSVEPDDRFANTFILDPSKVYLWQAFWTPTSFRLVETAEERAVHLRRTQPRHQLEAEMFAFLGTNMPYSIARAELGLGCSSRGRRRFRNRSPGAQASPLGAVLPLRRDRLLGLEQRSRRAAAAVALVFCWFGPTRYSTVEIASVRSAEPSVRVSRRRRALRLRPARYQSGLPSLERNWRPSAPRLHRRGFPRMPQAEKS